MPALAGSESAAVVASADISASVRLLIALIAASRISFSFIGTLRSFIVLR